MNEAESFGTFERTISPLVSVERALSLCEQSGFDVKLRSVGDTLKTSDCLITNSTGRKACGRGKGLGAQSVASAIFEALEHFHYGFETVPQGEAIPLNLQDWDKELNGGSPDFSLICSSNRMPLTRLRFLPIGRNSPELMLPAFLMNPYYQPTDLSEQQALQSFGLHRYGTNSGTASGLTEEDAVLHGLLETIERDAIGIELLRTVVRKEAFPARRLCQASLTKRLHDLCEAICHQENAAIELWDITNDLGVPAVLVALSTENKQRYFGSGSSLSPHNAVERAVLEALQCLHTYTVFKSPRPLFGATEYTATSLFQRCFLEAGHFDYRGGVADVRFEDIAQPFKNVENASPAEQLEKLVRKLSRLKINTYWRRIYADTLYVVQVCAPRLERFHLVGQGIPVLPGARGRLVLG